MQSKHLCSHPYHNYTFTPSSWRWLRDPRPGFQIIIFYDNQPQIILINVSTVKISTTASSSERLVVGLSESTILASRGVMGFLCNWGTKWIWHLMFGTTSRLSFQLVADMVNMMLVDIWNVVVRCQPQFNDCPQAIVSKSSRSRSFNQPTTSKPFKLLPSNQIKIS